VICKKRPRSFRGVTASWSGVWGGTATAETAAEASSAATAIDVHMAAQRSTERIFDEMATAREGA